MKLKITSNHEEGQPTRTAVALVTSDGQEFPLQYCTNISWEHHAGEIAEASVTFISTSKSPIELHVVSLCTKEMLIEQISAYQADIDLMQAQVVRMDDAEDDDDKG